MSKIILSLFAGLISVSLSTTTYAEEMIIDELNAVFGMLTIPEDIHAEKAALGNQLFHDPRLSSNGEVSCASCHILADGGDDGLAVSIGVSGNPTERNSPTVFNLNNHVAYFWDGRAATLVEQIDGPVHHPDEMGENWGSIIRKLVSDPMIRKTMARLYGGVSEAAIKDAIAEFERSLVTNDSPFDDYLGGDMAALDATAVAGLQRFMDYGCASCHQGPTVGGNLFQEFGVYLPIGPDGETRERLKVPSLRNVQHTAPYFNDGREPTLGGAIKTMGEAQLGRALSDEEISEIKAFLQALSSPRFAAQRDEP